MAISSFSCSTPLSVSTIGVVAIANRWRFAIASAGGVMQRSMRKPIMLAGADTPPKRQRLPPTSSKPLPKSVTAVPPAAGPPRGSIADTVTFGTYRYSRYTPVKWTPSSETESRACRLYAWSPHTSRIAAEGVVLSGGAVHRSSRPAETSTTGLRRPEKTSARETSGASSIASSSTPPMIAGTSTPPKRQVGRPRSRRPSPTTVTLVPPP